MPNEITRKGTYVAQTPSVSTQKKNSHMGILTLFSIAALTLPESALPAPPPIPAADGKIDFYFFQGRKIQLKSLPLMKSGSGESQEPWSGAGSFGESVRGQTGTGMRPVYLDPATNLKIMCTGRVIIKLRAKLLEPAALLGEITGRLPVRFIRNLKVTNTYLFETAEDPLSIAERLRGLRDVEWAEPDFIGEMLPTLTPNDPLFTRQQHLHNTGQNGAKPGADLHATQAWNIGWGAGDVTVAVFDDGIESHPDLNIAPGGRNLIDDPPTDDWSPQPNASGHGNSCAGLIGAIGNNSIGVVGVVSGAKVLPMRITDYPDDGFASSTRLAEGILYASEQADVGSVSIIGITSNIINSALTQAAKNGRKGKGFLFFSSSGNGGNGTLTYPSLYESSISIGSSTDEDLRAGYSQWGAKGKTVEFLAPSSGGRNGITTVDRVGAKGFSSGSYTSGFGGTSAATPIAAGVAALIIAINPDLTGIQVLNIMRSTCDKIGILPYVNGVNAEYGHGRLNMFEALKKIPPYISEQPRSDSATSNTGAYLSIAARGYQVKYQWQRPAPGGTDWKDIPGAANPILSLRIVTSADSGKYRCIAANANGKDTSDVAVLMPAPGTALPIPVRVTSGLRVDAIPSGSGFALSLNVPHASHIRLDLIEPSTGRSRALVDQFLNAGRYRVEKLYRTQPGQVWAYRLVSENETVSGKWVLGRTPTR